MPARLSIILSLPLLLLPLGKALAAPQLLGLIAASGPVPLTCEGARCTAELSSFCLQPDRPVPAAGTGYRLHGDHGLTLVVTTAEGRTHRIDARDRLRFASARNYTAVTVSLRAETLAALGAVSAAVALGEGLVLVPGPAPGDARPQSPAETALTARIRRTAGTRTVDRSPRAAAARILGLIVNRLSPGGHDRVTPRAQLWREALARSGQGPEAAGTAEASRAYEGCRGRRSGDSDAGLRWCLQLRHDRLIQGLTSDYWAAIRSGS